MKGRSVAIWKFLTVLGASNSDILGSLPYYQYVNWGKYRFDARRFTLPSYECASTTWRISLHFVNLPEIPRARPFLIRVVHKAADLSSQANLSVCSQDIYDTLSTTHFSLILN